MEKIYKGITYQEKTGCGLLYVTCNDKDGKLNRIFLTLGKSGGCAAAFMRTLGILTTHALRSGLPADEVLKSFGGIGCHQNMCCVDAISKALKEHESNKEKRNQE